MKILTLFVSLFLLVGCEPSQANTNELVIKTAKGDEHPFTVELALSPEQIQKGLMHRTELAENAGMLFVFANERERRFWMRNTLIPLDMIFVKKDGTIHHIHPEAVPMDLTSISSRGPVLAVLEINGGLAKKLGIRPGDQIIHPFFDQ